MMARPNGREADAPETPLARWKRDVTQRGFLIAAFVGSWQALRETGPAWLSAFFAVSAGAVFLELTGRFVLAAAQTVIDARAAAQTRDREARARDDLADRLLANDEKLTQLIVHVDDLVGLLRLREKEQLADRVARIEEHLDLPRLPPRDPSERTRADD